MPTMNAEMYDALIAAGAPEAKARSAAIAISEESLATKSDVGRVEGLLKTEIARVENRMTAIEGKLTLLQWMLALVVAATVIPLFRDLL